MLGDVCRREQATRHQHVEQCEGTQVYERVAIRAWGMNMRTARWATGPVPQGSQSGKLHVTIPALPIS